MKPPAVFQSDEEVDTDFDSDSDYIESEHAPEQEEIQGKYAFLQNHPLYETHQVNISKSKNLVPNFAGGSLPRCDRGDREYYCATMLTLFKPWRHGKNLKEDDQSWDEAFTNYTFTPRQIELGGVGHCFAWHVRVNLGCYFNFKIEEFVHSGLYAL